MATKKINILIVEDEAIVALDLSKGLEKDGYEVAGIADNAAEALEIFCSREIDIVLMDVNIIGEKDGIETAAELLKFRPVPLIYLTAFTDADTIIRAKNTYPSAFLAKPYNLTNVRIAIELAISNFAIARQPESDGKPGVAGDKDNLLQETILQMNDNIFVKNNYTFIKILLSDIVYLEAENNYVQFVTTDKKLLLRLSLGQLLEKINYKPLVRIHRSFAVNINAIQSFTEQDLLVNKNGSPVSLPIGRSFKESFLKNFNFR